MGCKKCGTSLSRRLLVYFVRFEISIDPSLTRTEVNKPDLAPTVPPGPTVTPFMPNRGYHLLDDVKKKRNDPGIIVILVSQSKHSVSNMEVNSEKTVGKMKVFNFKRQLNNG